MTPEAGLWPPQIPAHMYLTHIYENLCLDKMKSDGIMFYTKVDKSMAGSLKTSLIIRELRQKQKDKVE